MRRSRSVETLFATQREPDPAAHARGEALLVARGARWKRSVRAAPGEERGRRLRRSGEGTGRKDGAHAAPGCASLKMSADAADALAIAICHAHTAGTAARLKLKA
jgi:hypothetical protein